jgi:cell division protein FtsW
MAFVLVAGAEVKGAQRWIHLPFGSIQPSEFAKPAFAVVIAWFMARQKDQPGFPGDRLAAGLYALLISLLILQPDFGMSMLVTAIIVGQVFLAGLPLRLVVGLGGVAALGGVGAYFGLHHVRSRIDRFLNPETGDTYQIDLARQAFQEGGAFGAGPGQGTVKLAIPDAHTDFVFSVAGEEMGLVLLLIIIGLFAWVILRGLNRVMDSDNMFVILGTGGLLTMFGCQSLVHMGSNLALIPTKGMTLPFLSYGGSSLVAVGIGMGFLLALTRRQGRSTIAKGGMAPKTQMNAS